MRPAEQADAERFTLRLGSKSLESTNLGISVTEIASKLHGVLPGEEITVGQVCTAKYQDFSGIHAATGNPGPCLDRGRMW